MSETARPLTGAALRRYERSIAQLPEGAEAIIITNGPRKGLVIDVSSPLTRPCPRCAKRVQYYADGRPRPHAVPSSMRKDPRQGEACKDAC